MSADLVRFETASGGIPRLILAAPRANALTPELLDALRAALDRVERADPATLILSGGRNFCSGGDIARFHRAGQAGEIRAYARRVVPALQEALLRLVRLPACVAVAARGAITGGGAGFLFAADCAVLAPDAFVQPCYGQVGFAPDGGWTALLPDRIGHARAGAWIATDRRMTAPECMRMGLCDGVAADPVEALRALLSATSARTRLATKALLRDAGRPDAARDALAAETAAFLEAVAAPDVALAMARFLDRGRDADDV